MNNGEVKIGASVLPITEWKIEQKLIDTSCFNLNEMIKQRQNVSIHMEGTITHQNMSAMLELMYQNARTEHYMLVDFHTYWACVYATQGKRYPSLRKRKSKMRMSKKWRHYRDGYMSKADLDEITDRIFNPHRNGII